MIRKASTSSLHATGMPCACHGHAMCMHAMCMHGLVHGRVQGPVQGRGPVQGLAHYRKSRECFAAESSSWLPRTRFSAVSSACMHTVTGWAHVVTKARIRLQARRMW